MSVLTFILLEYLVMQCLVVQYLITQVYVHFLSCSRAKALITYAEGLAKAYAVFLTPSKTFFQKAEI